MQGNFRLRRLVPVERSGNGDKTLERVVPLNWGVPVGRKGVARCAPREPVSIQFPDNIVIKTADTVFLNNFS